MWFCWTCRAFRFSSPTDDNIHNDLSAYCNSSVLRENDTTATELRLDSLQMTRFCWVGGESCGIFKSCRLSFICQNNGWITEYNERFLWNCCFSNLCPDPEFLCLVVSYFEGLVFPCISCPCDWLPCSWLVPPVWLLAPPSLCPPVSRSPVSNHLQLPVYLNPVCLIPSVGSYCFVHVWPGLSKGFNLTGSECSLNAPRQ